VVHPSRFPNCGAMLPRCVSVGGTVRVISTVEYPVED
jgi:hypothetical protein